MLTIDAKLVDYLRPSDHENAHTLPAEFYTNANFFNIEQRAIFENTWQLAAHTEQLKTIGDQIVTQVGRIPIVIVRNQTNQLKAFHNVCRHRAGPVAVENANSNVLRCKYHGWTYTLDGVLKSAPEMSTTPNFDLCQHHLPEAKLALWQGFIFVCVSGSPPSIDELLTNITEIIWPIKLAKMNFSHRDDYLINCNWKVYMDNYLEGYHLPHVHPGLNKLLDYRSYSTEITTWYSYQHSPLEKAAVVDNFYGEGNAHYYCIYPNLMLNILPGRLQTNLILPIAHDKTRVVFDYYYSNPEATETAKLIAQDREFSDEVQEEDVDICQKVQQGLNSGSYHAGRLCMKRETGVLHFQNLVRASIQTRIENGEIEINRDINS